MTLTGPECNREILRKLQGNFFLHSENAGLYFSERRPREYNTPKTNRMQEKQGK